MVGSTHGPSSTPDRVPRLGVLLHLLPTSFLFFVSLFFHMDVIHHGLYTPLDVGSTGKGLANTAAGAKMSVAALPRPRIVWVFQATIIGRRRIVYSPRRIVQNGKKDPKQTKAETNKKKGQISGKRFANRISLIKKPRILESCSAINA